MAVCFYFSARILLVLIIFTKFYVFCYASINEFHTAADFESDYNLRLLDYSGFYRSNDDLFTAPPVLQWTRPPGSVPFRPRTASSVRCVILAVLLLSGDVEANPGPSISHQLNFGYINAQSVVQKTAVVHSLIDELKLDCLAITETWIKSDAPDAVKCDPAPPGYVIFHAHRQNNGLGGGVAFVARDEMCVRQIPMTGSYAPCDLLAVRLSTRVGRLNVVVLYRPPQSAAFHEQLSDLLDEVSTLPGRLLLCGDFNCPSTSAPGSIDKSLTNLLVSYNLHQHVTSITRSTGLLDLLITSATDSSLMENVTVRDLGISDHYVITATVKASWQNSSCVTYTRRNCREIDLQTFKRKLLQSGVCINPKSTANEFAIQLRDDVIKVLDEIAPLKKVTKRRGKRTADWLSTEAKDARRARRRLERRYRGTKTESDRAAYRSACRAANKLIKQSRRDHITKRLVDASNDPRQRWRITNELLHTSDEKHRTSIDITDGQKLSDKFCDFFINKVCTIRRTITDSLNSNSFVLHSVESSKPARMEAFEVVTDYEVARLISSSPSKTSPLDFLPVSLIKECSDVFSGLICRLANLSFAEGVFPDLFKLGHITPLIKKQTADPNDPASYRPITNLNTVGKILERLAKKRLLKHLSESPNWGTFQSAYRPLHSTETAMTRVVNDLLMNVDCGKPSVLLSLDISAAFDTLDHGALLQRTSELFGLYGQVSEWLRTYLSCRTAYVSLAGFHSATADFPTGVPQGSVLGPLLFSIFTVPCGRLISTYNIPYHQYADDNQLYTVIDPSTSIDIQRLSDCAEAVTAWHLHNGLLLNPAKTEALVTGTRHQVAKMDSVAGIGLAGAVIPFAKTVKVLGVTIDQHLTFDDHISKVAGSCRYHIRALRHIRRLIDRETANTLACSIVATRLDYCNSVLSGITAKNITRLQRVQNSLARVVCCAPYRSPSRPMLQSLHWLPIEYRIQHKIATLTFKVRFHRQPNYLHELITTYTPNRPLRSSDAGLLAVPRTSTTTADRAFRVTAPRIWNSLPETIRSATSVSQFTRRLKSHLFSVAFS